MRFHEALLCVIAVIAPLIAALVSLTWWVPALVFAVISLPLVWLTGWLVEHS